MAESTNRPSPRRLRILYLEDRLADMELSLMVLERAGISCEAKRVETEKEFIRELQLGGYDLVLSDHRLTGWNGMDVLRQMQALKINLPFILVTGTMGDDSAVECIKLGVWDFVLKDNLGRLPLAVQRALHDYQEQVRRKEIEDQLLLQSAALAAAADSIMITDAGGSIEWVNPSFCTLTQYSSDEIVGQNPRILESGMHDSAFFEDLWKTILAGKVWRGRITNRRKDGSLYVEEETITPVRSEQGIIQHFIAIKQDISLREELRSRLQSAQIEIRESEEQYRLLFEANPNPMWVYDVETMRFLAVNNTAVRHYGYSREEFLSTTIKTVRPPEELPRFMAEYEAWDKTEDVDSGVWKHAKKDGTPITVEVSSRAIMFRGRRSRLVLAVDITARMRAEEALKASEAQYRSIIEEAPIGIYRVTDDGRILMANPALVKMLGYESEADILKLNTRTDVYCTAEDREEARSIYLKQTQVKAYEARLKRRDGEIISVRSSGTKLSTGTGENIYEVFVEDVTGQRLLEQQFRQAQKMEAVGRLAAGVAHDFNNLLMVIGSSAELLTGAKANPEMLDRYVEQIRSATDKAASVTRQLLAFSRQQVLQPKVLQLNKVAEDLWKILPRLVGEDIEMVKALDPNAGRVSADPGQIEQVIVNLVVNARDAMPKGGKIIIETTSVLVDESYVKRHSAEMKTGSYTVLAVTDNGTGMDAQTQARIFEPFFTTKEAGKGTGLGLATVYGIVKQSGGFIWVYSEVGHGTTFKIYLPTVDALPEVEQATTRHGAEVVGSGTVLLVEDEPVLRESVGEYLRSRGYTVIEAASGPEAVRQCETHGDKIDLLITDSVMPGFGGEEVAKRVLRRYPAVRIIHMSGYTDRKLETLDLGGRSAYLQKPFSLATLDATVSRLLK